MQHRADKPARKRFLLRIDPELWNEVETCAADDLRSINAEVEWLGLPFELERVCRRSHRLDPLALPGGGTSINLTTEHANMKPGTPSLHLATPDSEAADNQLNDDGASQNADDLYGLGSGVKWSCVDGPESNHWMIVQETKGDGHESQ